MREAADTHDGAIDGVIDGVIDSAAFRRALGRYPTGVVAITGIDADGAPLVLLVGSFTSVSLVPPLVGFFPSLTSTTWPRIAAGGYFAANVLAADQHALCRQLAGSADRFTGVAWRRSNQGLPLIEGVIATIECQLHSVSEAGDHLFVLGAVERLTAWREASPMIFHGGRYGGFAALD